MVTAGRLGAVLVSNRHAQHGPHRPQAPGARPPRSKLFPAPGPHATHGQRRPWRHPWSWLVIWSGGPWDKLLSEPQAYLAVDDSGLAPRGSCTRHAQPRVRTTGPQPPGIRFVRDKTRSRHTPIPGSCLESLDRNQRTYKGRAAGHPPAGFHEARCVLALCRSPPTRNPACADLLHREPPAKG